jgi:hypothetical protein
MAKLQIRSAMFLFFIVWLQIIPTAIHRWRAGNHWTSSYTSITATVFSILGVVALTLARRALPKEGIVS